MKYTFSADIEIWPAWMKSTVRTSMISQDDGWMKLGAWGSRNSGPGSEQDGSLSEGGGSRI